MAIFSGKIDTVVFSNPSDNFYILRVHLDELPVGVQNPVTARGKVFGLEPKRGSWLSFDAIYDTHPKYGKQLKIRKAPVLNKKKMDKRAVAGILISQGVSEIVAYKITSKFGDLSYAKLNSSKAVQSLKAVDGITSIAAEFIHKKWKDYMAFFQTYEFFEQVGVPKKKFDLVWQTFGQETKTILSSNPWRITRIDGITFEQADGIARHLKLPFDCPERVQGACLYTLKSWRGMGHLFLSFKELCSGVFRLVDSTSNRKIRQALLVLHDQKDLIFEGFLTSSGETKEVIYTTWNYHLESKGAEYLSLREKSSAIEKDPSALSAYKFALVKHPIPNIGGSELDTMTLKECARIALDYEAEINQIDLSEAQYQAALNALLYPVSIITGLPGTGKTTTLKFVVRVLQRAGATFKLVAPTGIASKRLQQVTGVSAFTIHRAFGSKGGKDTQERESTYYGIVGESSSNIKEGDGEKWTELIPEQVLICDEASMVDQHLLYRMLQGTNPSCRLILVGDAAQLPSVGAGNVLRELIEYGEFPVVSLTEIFRQSDTSDIIYAAHDIYRGNVPELKANQDTDFVFIPMQGQQKILNLIKRLSHRLYQNRDRFQVMSPRHSGDLGVTNLNMHLRELLNPSDDSQKVKNHIRVGDQILREEDRVMIIRNDYSKGIFNGDTGKVYRIQPDKKVIVKVHGETPFYVEFTPTEVYQYLRLAYATTVHKMQGQETDIIIIPLVNAFRSQLQRNLFYTAITRAKKRVFVIGDASAVSRAVLNSKEEIRNTLFAERIKSFEISEGKDEAVSF